MGNCLDLQKPVTWVEDDEREDGGFWEWESTEKKKQRRQKEKKDGGSTAGGATAVKIKISKKQLEELLRQVDGEQVPLRQALFYLASGGTEEKQQQHRQPFHHHQEHWTPELQSIPEAPECDSRRY